MGKVAAEKKSLTLGFLYRRIQAVIIAVEAYPGFALARRFLLWSLAKELYFACGVNFSVRKQQEYSIYK